MGVYYVILLYNITAAFTFVQCIKCVENTVENQIICDIYVVYIPIMINYLNMLCKTVIGLCLKRFL